MSIPISYNSSDGDVRAMLDILEWLGAARYTELCEHFKAADRHGTLTFEAFALYCAFAGIKGYPVRVWYRELFNRDPAANEEG